LSKEKMMEEQILALESEKLVKENEEVECSIMVMNPNSLDPTARAH
jgi:hypothetical protein